MGGCSGDDNCRLVTVVNVPSTVIMDDEVVVLYSDDNKAIFNNWNDDTSPQLQVVVSVLFGFPHGHDVTMVD